MGVSDLSLYSSLAYSLTNTSSNLEQVEEQIATGKQVVVPSDNPTEYAASQVLGAQQSAVSNDLVLAQQVQAQLNTANGALSNVSNAIDSAISVATEGANATTSTSTMTTLGAQVQSILQQVIGQANSQYGGSYLFAGNQVQAAPYASSGSYGGDSGTNSVTFSNGNLVQTNFDGQAIFGDTSSGLIGTLTSLASALNSGNQAAVSSALPLLQTALANLASAQGSLGINLQTANNLVTDATSQSTTLQTQITNLVGVNVAQAATTEQELVVQQQALVSMGSGLAQIPLINILA
jgi:flagellar hook-associated protein 3 FlgL